MAVLNDRQLKILRVIDAGSMTGEDIATAVGSSMQLLSYYLNTLSDDGYLKIAKVYDNFTREFQIVRAYLTSEGKQALAQAEATQAVLSTAQPTVPLTSATISNTAPSSIPVVDRASANEASHSSSDHSSDLNLNYSTLAQHITAITPTLEHLPPNRRELVSVYLEDLTIEVNQPDKRRSNRIKAYFFAILNTVLPILKHLPQPESFTQQIQAIAQILQLPIKLPE
ncbi:hypothetical protein ACN4EG_17445 [Alkalinema pantanalense CENA528]|uniref:hypothetical protein n=1 Tax=Alkalinema pantanalense TaxID=1620705 RepID=UPI003D6EAC66